MPGGGGSIEVCNQAILLAGIVSVALVLPGNVLRCSKRVEQEGISEKQPLAQKIELHHGKR